ncbi:hypothetical protein CPB84DRAFT_1747345 [Gymnopilus junonius]|uniref:Alpha-type protein kinase domain-containing protein n=1 Tax=Gymnopilus junonius TaxID=109634 RepID=A0A9P5NQJ0_GYMJU|nr:hypothetical protein CPB84DRAFT_1747345 [Gymnopilus junonius]
MAPDTLHLLQATFSLQPSLPPALVLNKACPFCPLLLLYCVVNSNGNSDILYWPSKTLVRRLGMTPQHTTMTSIDLAAVAAQNLGFETRHVVSDGVYNALDRPSGSESYPVTPRARNTPSLNDSGYKNEPSTPTRKAPVPQPFDSGNRSTIEIGHTPPPGRGSIRSTRVPDFSALIHLFDKATIMKSYLLLIVENKPTSDDPERDMADALEQVLEQAQHAFGLIRRAWTYFDVTPKMIPASPKPALAKRSLRSAKNLPVPLEFLLSDVRIRFPAPFIRPQRQTIVSLLSRWLWSKVLQLELDAFMHKRNAQIIRKDKKKAGPSGCSRNDAFCLPAKYGLKNMLLPLNDEQLEVVAEIKEALGGEALLEFVPPEWSTKFEQAFLSLGVVDFNMQNAWHIFEALLPLLTNHKKEAQIPRAILSIPGVAALLLEEDAAAADDAFVMSDEAAAVVASAQQFQANSSGLRLTKKTISGHGSETTGLNRSEQDGSIFGPETHTQNALDTLLESIQTAFSNRHPDVEPLTWPHIHLYAHESQQKYVSLDYFIRELPMSQFFNEFMKGKLAADNMLKDKKIEIHFAYFMDDVASSSVAKSSQLIPGNKKLKTTDPDIIPAPLLSGSSRLLPTHLKSFEFAIPDIPPAVRPVPILRSAFSSFIRTTASYMPVNGLNVEFKVARDVEEIQIAAHWEKPDNEGYIGEGFTKWGIYTNLCSTYFKQSIACFALGMFSKVNLIAMPKNVKLSPFQLDGKLKKFTGNDEFSDADNHLTKAVHAFSHFTAVYTQETLVLCDLQVQLVKTIPAMSTGMVGRKS